MPRSPKQLIKRSAAPSKAAALAAGNPKPLKGGVKKPPRPSKSGVPKASKWVGHEPRAIKLGNDMASMALAEVSKDPLVAKRAKGPPQSPAKRGAYDLILKTFGSGIMTTFSKDWRALAPRTDEAVGTALVNKVIAGAFDFLKNSNASTQMKSLAAEHLARNIASWSRYRLPTKIVGFRRKNGTFMQHSTSTKLGRAIWEKKGPRNGTLHTQLDDARREKAIAAMELAVKMKESLATVARSGAFTAGVYTLNVFSASATASNMIADPRATLKQKIKATILRERLKVHVTYTSVKLPQKLKDLIQGAQRKKSVQKLKIPALQSYTAPQMDLTSELQLSPRRKTPSGYYVKPMF